MGAANRRNLEWFLLVLLMACLPVFAGNSTNSVQSAVALLNSGNLPGAERILTATVAETVARGHRLDEAIARKWLGVALARSGVSRLNEATNELSRAGELLKPLADKGDPEAREQMGMVLFDQSETLRTYAESQMREQRLAGVSASMYFGLVRDFVSPAEAAIEKAKDYYPKGKSADIEYARGELALLLARLSETFMPDSDTTSGYERSINCFRKARLLEQANGKDARNDVIISAAIRIAEIKRELVRNSKADVRQVAFGEALKELAAVRDLPTDQAEIASHLIYTRAVCRLEKDGTPSSEQAKEIETDLLKAADLVETMRGKFKGGTTFENSGSFFSQRTHVYEALCRLYAATKQPEKMLAAIEKMKARAFRDILATASGPNFDLPALQKHLRQDKAGLVEYFYGPEHAWAFWVPPDSAVETIDLPINGQDLVLEMQKVSSEFAKSRDGRGWMRMCNGNMRQGEMVTMREGFHAANRLYELLLRLLEQKANAAKVVRLYVVPHHVMNYLSFNSLVTEVNETNLLSSKFYVESGLPVTYLPSAAVLSEIGSIADVAGGSNYVFARGDFHSIKPNFPADLTGTLPEAKMVAKIASASAFYEADASEFRLRSLSGSLNLIYFATHGILDKELPLNSAILLAATDEEKTSLDGRVKVGELLTDFRGKLQANLVVLSACHTNEGEPTPASGDDLTALSRGFMVAGGRSILATQWEASDATFPEIMGFFLDGWMKQRQSKDKALNSALRQFLVKNDFPIWRHPHFWAPVVLMGEAK